VSDMVWYADLVWSDPEDVDTWAVSPRGAGWLFGNKVTNEVRSHSVSFSVCVCGLQGIAKLYTPCQRKRSQNVFVNVVHSVLIKFATNWCKRFLPE